jgi:3,4-dihydroxy-2-butanone 4-phosphate synthase
MAPQEDSFTRAIEAFAAGKPVAVLDSEAREGETDLFIPAQFLQAKDLRWLRTLAGGELYISVGQEVAALFQLPFIGKAVKETSWAVLRHMQKDSGGMCQGR